MSRNGQRAIWIALLLFALAAVSRAGPPAARADSAVNYTATAWRVEEGLPDDTVQSFAENPDGRLWIGTSGGLALFDGTHFQLFTNNDSLFDGNSVHCLITAHDGSLWIGTEGNGLIHVRNGAVRAWTAKDGLADMFVRAIAEDRSGRLWIGTNNGFFRLIGNRIERLDGSGGIPTLAVNAILEDRSGRLWIGGSRVMSIRNGQFQEHRLPGEPSRNRVKSLLQTHDGAIWVGTVSGLYRSPDGIQPFHRVPGVHGTVRVLRQDADGTLWISIVGQGGATWKLGPDGRLLTAQMRIPGTVLSIFQDHERNIWVGTQSGMIRYSRTPVSILPLADARTSDFGTIYLDRDGALWSVTTHLVRIAEGHAQPFTFPALHGAKIRNLLRDRDGSLWIGTDGSGLFHLLPNATHRYTTAQGLPNNFIRVLVQARDGSFWIGTDEGVSHLSNGHSISYGVRDGLAYFSIRSMLQDRQGGIWIGTDQGLSHLIDGHFVTDAPVMAMRREKVWAIHQDSDGGLWFGTRNHGLYRYRASRLTQFSVPDGLASNAVYAILEDAAGHLWISSPGSVSLLNRHELDACADRPAGRHVHPFAVTTYNLPDEDGPVEIFGGVQSTGVITPRGDVWFPSSRGLVHVTLPDDQPWSIPRLTISQVTADHMGSAWSPGTPRALLHPGNSRLSLSWGLVTLSSQQNMRFRYRLENFDREWINALGRRDTSYANLPPGRYVFEVQALKTDHPGAVSQASLVVIKEPYFYRRWWFLLCMAMVFVAAILSIFRARLNRMRQRFIGVLEERNRIAREIHDTVIQGCTGVSAALEAVSTIPPAHTELRDKLLDRARSQIRDTINEARNAVWDLRQEVARGQLDSSLTTMSAQIAREFGIPVHCSMHGCPFRASQHTTHEILMIAREAVHNAVLHAAPSAVNVTAEFGADLLTLEIVDDGSGFDLGAVSAARKRHYGLLGMRERAARLNGKIEIRSIPGHGTQVVFRVPRKNCSEDRTLVEKVETL